MIDELRADEIAHKLCEVLEGELRNDIRTDLMTYGVSVATLYIDSDGSVRYSRTQREQFSVGVGG